MFARFKIVAVGTTHAAGHPDDALAVHREPALVGEAFEHADGSIAVYLDALPVSGRMLLEPVDDLRAHPVRRGAIGGTDIAKLRQLQAAAVAYIESQEGQGQPMSGTERAALEQLQRLLP